MTSKNFLISLFIALATMAVSSTPAMAADAPEYDFPVTPSDPEKGDPGTNRNRMPARPVNCSISHDGVSIEGIAESVETFEVRDMDGNTVAIFSEEKAFISFIFSTEGDFELIFRLHSRTLHGFISL